MPRRSGGAFCRSKCEEIAVRARASGHHLGLGGLRQLQHRRQLRHWPGCGRHRGGVLLQQLLRVTVGPAGAGVTDRLRSACCCGIRGARCDFGVDVAVAVPAAAAAAPALAAGIDMAVAAPAPMAAPAPAATAAPAATVAAAVAL